VKSHVAASDPTDPCPPWGCDSNTLTASVKSHVAASDPTDPCPPWGCDSNTGLVLRRS
jgi:hypothetical protein